MILMPDATTMTITEKVTNADIPMAKVKTADIISATKAADVIMASRSTLRSAE